MRDRRKELNIKADVIAEAVGVSRSTIYRYENRYIEKLPINNLIPIAEALNTTVEYLTGCVDNPEYVPESARAEKEEEGVLTSISDEQKLLKKYRMASPEIKRAVDAVLESDTGEYADTPQERLRRYLTFAESTFSEDKARSILKKDPSVNGAMSCLVTKYPDDEREHHIKSLRMIMREQHHCPVMREFVNKNIILKTEAVIKKIISTLMETNELNGNKSIAMSDFWAVAGSSIFYTFSSRYMLGIGDIEKDFNSIGMEDALKSLFELLFLVCGNK
jgi:transcriptional regulator with XRE-family HTH domain